MASQFHVAFSADVNGVGAFAGSKLRLHTVVRISIMHNLTIYDCTNQVPYGCAKGSLGGALNCMSSPFLTSVPTLIERTDTYARDGSVDPTSNMAGDRVYVFHGTRDTTVNNRNGEQIVEYYQNYLSSPSDTVTEFTIAAEHCQVKNWYRESNDSSIIVLKWWATKPTDNFGGVCNRQNSANYINDCDYRGAFVCLNHMYGGSLLSGETTVAPLSNLYQFDQAEFFGGRPASYSMDSVGYVYIPTECKDPTRYCKLHVVLHGCLQSR